MIKMMPGRVLLKQKETTKIGEIYLPTVQIDPIGQVVAIGDTLVLDNGRKMPAPVKAGTWVMFKQTGDAKLIVDNKEYLHLTFDDLIVAIDEQD